MKKLLPDFIIAGAPKCGTTALWHFLNQHPDIFLTPDKEPRFFTKLKGGMENKITGDGPRLPGTYSKGFEWYAGLFKNALPNQIKGEASTVYFANEDAAELIYKNKPDVKIIIMLRHPVKRIYSHYWQEHKLGFKFPSFEEMIKEDNLRLRYYKKVSHYATHLQRYLKIFSTEQLHIIIQEEFNKAPEENFQQALDFLNVSAVGIDFNKRINEQVTPKNRLLAKTLAVSKQMRIDTIVPSFILQPVNKLRKKLVRANVKAFYYPPMPAEVFNLLMPEYISDIEFVENLLSVKLPSWR